MSDLAHLKIWDGLEGNHGPIVIARNSGGAELWIVLSSPVAPEVPVSPELRALGSEMPVLLLCIDDLLIRRNLPAAVRQVQARYAIVLRPDLRAINQQTGNRGAIATR